jgi:chromosome segregation ATPase
MGPAVIQSILFFALGFLCAGLLALLIAPAVWRRAVRLTRKRVEASVPLTLDEIQADRDQLRAEFALSTRRLEMSVKELRDKAAAQLVEIGGGREELRQLAAERDEKDRSLGEIEARSDELKAELGRRQEELEQLAERLAESDQALAARASEFDRLNGLYETANLASVHRQAELLARAGEVDRLSTDLGMLMAERGGMEKRIGELEAELHGARDAARTEKKKAVDLEKRVERMLATVADREEAVERREKDLAQMRERLKGETTRRDELDARLTRALDEKLQLEARVADLTARLADGRAKTAGKDASPEKRGDLEQRIVALTQENAKLRADAVARDGAGVPPGGQDARLREQMNEIAAGVIALTARLDGPDSPIRAVVGTPAGNASPDRPLSLADRVRALMAGPASAN